MKPKGILTASFRRRPTWVSVLTLGYAGMFEPEVDLDNRPDYVPTPLRRPGETVELACLARSDAAMFGLAIALFPAVGGVLALWLAGYQGYGTLHLWIALILLTSTGAAIYLWNLRRIGALGRGYWAERRVGEYLNRLERDGARVLHYLQGDGFNVDHVVIHRAGVFAIETKAARPRRKGRPAAIRYENDTLTMGGTPMKGDALRQAKGSAEFVGQLLVDVGERPEVQPVLLCPDRFIGGTPRNPGDVWVLNPKAFPKWLRRKPAAMTDEDVSRTFRLLIARQS
ncbi:nuclease-related domain-containing protein [Parvularcula dongshanensis]|uniref:NERD domain-containing protein n=1 Tax=Parvularcula dongshanensis TaxID=1173995 RepID=A0A840I8C0_9PROT|nr:nuclease-related domain-containing protein [Parvularcula dongshanensis]MBB4660200.1 hypothetical protein [Parvularcula dongshanensis]